ncbi:MAG: DUF6962 family protein [Oscillochloridaceae bacterium umkhey_bin13]
MLVASPTERTTAATDLVIAALALSYAAQLAPQPERRNRTWGAAFLGMGLAGLLGAIAHGLTVGPRTHAWLWRGIFLSLGLTVGLFAAAATNDGFGSTAGRRALPAAILAALGFYGLSQRLNRGFIVFTAYEAAALIYALAIYTNLARQHQLAGADRLAAGIMLSLVAAGVQATSLRLTVAGVPFDNNGLFHLIQIAALPLIAQGVQASQ